MPDLMLGPDRIEPPFILRKHAATLAEYEQITDEDVRCEFLDGVLVMHSPASWQHEELIAFLLHLLRAYVERHDLGTVVGSNAVMHLATCRRFCPDLMFVRGERLRRVEDGHLEGPADLVVEVLSETTEDWDLTEKRAPYEAGGVPEIWFIDPRGKHFLAVRRDAATYVEESLSAGPYMSRTIDGLKLRVDWLWPRPLPNVGACLDQIEADSGANGGGT